MKKIILITTIFLFSVIYSSKTLIGKDNEKLNFYYENFIEVDNTTDTNVHIKYPQIEGMNSLEKQKKINKLIKEKAIFTIYDEDKEIKDGLNLDVEAEITYSSSNLISIKYTGEYIYINSMRGYLTFYATNIDLSTSTIIDTKKLFNNNFNKFLNRNIFGYKGPYKSKDLKNIEPNTHEDSYINGDKEIVTELFDKYYNEIGDNMYYFDKNQLTLIVDVPFGPTATIELCANYEDLEDMFSFTTVVYEEFINKKNIEKLPFDIKKINNAIVSYGKTKKLQSVIQDLERENIKSIINIIPNGISLEEYVSVLNDYAYFLSETDRYKEAIPIIERVIELSPNRVVAYLNLGDCYYKDYKKSKKQSDKEKVVENYKKYVSLLKKDAKIPDRVKEMLEIK